MPEISFPPPAAVWSTNDGYRMHHMARARRVKFWRTTARLYAAQLGAQPPSVVKVTIPFSRRGRRDPMNYVGTVVKAVIDGLVDAELWPDDTPDYVQIVQPVLEVGELVKIELSPMAPVDA